MLFHANAAFGAASEPTMRRYGFGEQTGVTEAGGLAQYENGVVEFSEKAAKHATQQYPKESPAGAVALALAEVGGVDLSEYVEPPAPDVDTDALRASVESIDGVGEETAEKIMAALRDALGAGDGA